MSLNLSNFQQAEYVDATPVPVAPIKPDNGAFIKAIGGGMVGAAIAAVIYAAFIIITNISIGYLAIGVGYLIAKGMNLASGERGGRKYQIVAVALTYLSVAAAYGGILWWMVRKTGPVSLDLVTLANLAWFGVFHPFTRLAKDPFGGLIGLFILFIGIRAAWRMTSGIPGESHHPFAR